jgi:predicted CoA-binding protein
MATSATARDVTDAAASIAASAKRVAVVGVRPPIDRLLTRPAAFVPAALHADGVAIVPIPTTPSLEADTYFGATPLTSLADLANVPPVDVVVFFRKAADLPPAVQVIAALTAHGTPGPVAWLQSGIRSPDWEAELIAGGVPVVADRCMKVERARARL